MHPTVATVLELEWRILHPISTRSKSTMTIYFLRPKGTHSSLNCPQATFLLQQRHRIHSEMHTDGPAAFALLGIQGSTANSHFVIPNTVLISIPRLSCRAGVRGVEGVWSLHVVTLLAKAPSFMCAAALFKIYNKLLLCADPISHALLLTVIRGVTPVRRVQRMSDMHHALFAFSTCRHWVRCVQGRRSIREVQGAD